MHTTPAASCSHRFVSGLAKVRGESVGGMSATSYREIPSRASSSWISQFRSQFHGTDAEP